MFASGYIAFPLMMAWLTNGTVGSTRLAVATAMVIAFASAGGITGPYLLAHLSLENIWISFAACHALALLCCLLIYFTWDVSCKREIISHKASLKGDLFY